MAGMFGDAGGANTAAPMLRSSSNSTRCTRGTPVASWFVIALAILEQVGLSREWIGFIFLLATVGLYAGIGIMSRTTDAAEYYVAGRRVPAVYNGMATGADWMSAASFIGMAGTLYLTGYSGLAFIMGWTGGYCLVALFLAPYLRKFGQFTIPDFLGERYGGNVPRFHRHRGRHPVLLHLCGGADLWRWPDHHPPDRRGSSSSGFSWAWAAFWCVRSWAACAR
jgi:cation/acetate symporter